MRCRGRRRARLGAAWTAGLLVLGACTAAQPIDAPAAAPSTSQAVPATVTVVATGDVLIHQGGSMVRAAAAAGRAASTGYDFGAVLAEVAPVIRAADLAVCHLETPVAGPEGPFTGYPSFSVQPQILDALVDAGYDTCSTASNHSLDAGFDGLVRTLDALDARGLGHTGTFRTEAAARTPHLVDVAGVRVAQLSWTYGLNGIREPAGRSWAVNDFDPGGPDVTGILADAAAARRAGAEIVLVGLHCCTEYDPEPSATQDAVAAALLGSPDVDLVLGHHAHVVQPLERIGDEWVAHGLGNHVAQQVTRGGTYDSVMARFTFTRGPDGRFAATAAEALPTRIRADDSGLVVVRTRPGDPSYERVAATLDARGAVAAGLTVGGE
ncbi:CapA family protein [Pseudonocardia sp.]|uniref:CapA family protein n=1 Tax=Pseudonocardia sp. TaxID=60912 RepID=UPI00261DDC29|nr:CapA family protein [Pseudonocardia sp.]